MTTTTNRWQAWKQLFDERAARPVPTLDSDLDYTQLSGTFGVNYKLDRKATVYGSVNLLDLKDDQEYVYGDLTGSIVTTVPAIVTLLGRYVSSR